MIQKKIIEYSDQNQNIFEGVLVYDDEIKDKKPGILVVHTFKGLHDFEITKATELAKLGFIGFAVDLYGKGRRGKTMEEASKLMYELNSDRQLLCDRINLSLSVVKNFEQVDAQKTAAIGFCFGGKCVLDLARSGAEINGVVSFHGLYDKPLINQTQKINASVLVLHGWDDPLAPVEMVLELKKEMEQRAVDFQFLAFSQTGHSFTNPLANFKESGMFYQEKSNHRAWQTMRNFLGEVLG